MSYSTIILKPSQAFGDLIETTRVLKSINKTLPSTKVKVKVKEDERRQFFEGYLKQYSGFVSELIDYDIDYKLGQDELEIDLTWYQNELPNHKGFHYTEAMLRMAESQLLEKLNQKITLTREVESELIFPEEKFQKEIESGERKLEEILQQNPDKPLIWLGARTAGSQNRMPQNYHVNFWTDLINNLSDKYTFYEKRGPKDPQIHPEVYPKPNDSLSLVAESKIIKASAAGIGVDGMQIHLSYALGNKKMVVLLGPTHPNAVIYPGSENIMLTIPKEPIFCPIIGLHGYISIDKYPEIKTIMKEHDQGYEFPKEIQEALEKNSQDELNKIIRTLKCPLPNCCFSELTLEKVIEKLLKLLQN